MNSSDLRLIGLSRQFVTAIDKQTIVPKTREISESKKNQQDLHKGNINNCSQKMLTYFPKNREFIHTQSNPSCNIYPEAITANSRHILITHKWTNWYINRTSSAVVAMQVICLGVFTAFVTYAPLANAGDMQNSIDPTFGGYNHQNLTTEMLEFLVISVFVCVLIPAREVNRYQAQKIQLLVLIVFVMMDWAMICDAILQLSQQSTAEVDIHSITKAEMTALSVCLASMQFLRHTDLFQLLIFQLIIVPTQILNRHFIQRYLLVFDPSETICVHLFGALNGFSCLMVLIWRKNSIPRQAEPSNFHLIQTMLLLVLWPFLSIGNLPPSAQRRNIINSMLTGMSALVISYPISVIFSPTHQLNVESLKNSVIAANVMAGSVSPLMLQGYGAVIIGWLASFVSIYGNHLINKLLVARHKLDHAALIIIHHGLAGLIGGILTTLLAMIASPDIEAYGYSLYQLYKGRSPRDSSLDFKDASAYLKISPGVGRSAVEQGAYQLLSVFCTVSVATVSGLIIGGILNLNVLRTKSSYTFAEDYIIRESSII